MSTVSNVSSFRKITPGILASQRLAMSNDIPEIGKGEVAITLKRAAQPLGLSSTAYHILDILLGLSKSEDWKGDGRPIVAISNDKLASYVGRSTRTVMRAVKQLVEAGILAYRDSSTGRRWVRRNSDGEITHAYGLDFTPARIRYREIKRIADEWQAELNAEREAKRTITKASRAIIDIIEATTDVDLSDFHDQMTAIRASERDNQWKAGALQDLYDLLVEAMTEATETNLGSGKNGSMTPEGDMDDIPIFNTTSPNSCTYKKMPFANANEVQYPSDVAYGADMAPEREQAEPGGAKTTRKARSKRPGEADFTHSAALDGVSVALLQSACTSVQSDFGVSFSSWQELMSAAEVMRIGIGLSDRAYGEACGKLGRHAAAGILVVVAEKTLRDPDRISRPGGYFRACVERAIDGKLALAKSVFGLLNGS
ncbi:MULTISPECIES: plasmid replication protein RepC [unclassified Pannonibacter]|uniref:plasmid replication protein RepC n=1 Tax=unclassified Pannonibacter TaxID=2627228 RepID=UPI001647A5D7|nr:MULTISPECIES: plasmid replication protein RepC [unclassified Pannonibacter]